MLIFYDYIIKSIYHSKHYFGHTSDLKRRLIEHNLGLSKFTKKYIPWKVVYFEEFSTRSEAMRREKYFNSLAGYHWLKENNII